MVKRFVGTIIALASLGGAIPASGVTIVLDGLFYDVTTIVDSFEDEQVFLESQPWWGNSVTALSAANQVGGSLGVDQNDPGAGPWFAFNFQPPDPDVVAWTSAGAFVYPPYPGSQSATYAVAEEIPEPSGSSLLLLGAFGVLMRRRGRCH